MNETGEHVWRLAAADRAHVVIDAADYFDALRSAMMNARRRIMLIGWDFDTRIHLLRDGPAKDGLPTRLGDFILAIAKANPALEIRILKWDVGALKLLGRGRSILDVIRWALHKRIEFKLDSAHPAGCSHHQKIVVIDDRFAVCGGIDMTRDRWDTRAHLDDDPQRKEPNGQPYGPWHDVTMLVEGDAAAALGDLARDRWHAAGGSRLDPLPAQPDGETAWPEQVRAEFHGARVGISRTRACHEEREEVREIEVLSLALIARARRFIYAESQYFASRKIAEAIGRRLVEDTPPEIVLINPETADGWLESLAMDSARTRLLHALGPIDHAGRFRIYAPYAHRGTPIYVHAKLMIVDDEVVRVGSANMNNRSLGLDSECDLYIDSALATNQRCGDPIRALRISLIAEHCGMSEPDMAALLDRHGGSMHAAIGEATRANRRLRLLELRELSAAEREVADNAALDPEHAEDLFEPLSSPGLFRRLRRPR